MSLVEKYAEVLEKLTGKAFQDAVCTRLKSAIPSFQSIPDEGGDGGLDGYALNGDHGYCCYGLELDPAKTEEDYVTKIVDKFQKDLRRIFELVETTDPAAGPKGAAAGIAASNTGAATQVAPPVKTSLKHSPNKELESVLGKGAKIKHIILVVNRYKSKKVLGRLQTALKRYKAASQCRFVEASATLVLDGPTQLAELHHVDELILSLARQKDLAARINQAASTIPLPKSPDFDAKMALAKEIRPGFDKPIDAMTSDFKTDWKLALASERELSDFAPNLHEALDRRKSRLLVKVNKLMVESAEPWVILSTAGELAEEILVW